MNQLKTIIFILLAFALTACSESNENSFVKVKDGNFYLNNKEYVFLGANYWQGMNLGAPASGDRARLTRELDYLKSLNITNLRILAASEGDSEMKYCVHPALQTGPGIYNNDIWIGLDFLLSEMSKRNMKAVMVMSNFWTWSGGFPQYLKWINNDTIPFPEEEGTSWQDFIDYSKQFYTDNDAQELMNNHLRTIINRVNSITNVEYKNDPTIMAWQLANEPRGYDQAEAYLEWTKKTAALIKSLDKNHLVSLGTEGNTSEDYAGVDVFLDNNNPDIDYITFHIWVQNWSWFSPNQDESVYTEALKKVDSYWNNHVKAAKKLNKPMVLEEFGMARDGLNYSPDTTVTYRDRYFEYLYSKVYESIKNKGVVKGLNFWSYSGEVKPPRPGDFWKNGDPFLGDPPHERQGWYGVYNSDTTTISLIKKYTAQLPE